MREISWINGHGLGIFCQPDALVPNEVCTLWVVLVNMNAHSVPCLLKVECPLDWPWGQPHVRFLSKEPNPLVDDDGHVYLDWCPTFNISKLAIVLQNALTGPDGLETNCIADPNWESGEVMTPPAHVHQMLELLVAAVDHYPGEGPTTAAVEVTVRFKNRSL